MRKIFKPGTKVSTAAGDGKVINTRMLGVTLAYVKVRHPDGQVSWHDQHVPKRIGDKDDKNS